MNPINGYHFDVFRSKDDEYKITVLFVIKELSEDIKNNILNLVDINIEEEYNKVDYFEEDFFEEIFSDKHWLVYSQAFLDWFFTFGYQSD